MKVLVTGGAGFIGSALVRHLILNTDVEVVNVDKLTYAGNLTSLESISSSPRYQFAKLDICDKQNIENLLMSTLPDAVINLAAESHVDRSIDGPDDFIQTNIVGTYQLLQAVRGYWRAQGSPDDFRFMHVSTDEVFGDLEDSDSFFTELTPYAPNSPYAATKASSDHLVRAWGRTYQLPVLITNCSNNYGPFQFPEKLIPHMILNALANKPLPVYGNGTQIRDWLYVDDHARALCAVLGGGRLGETYNIGGHNEQRNIDVVRQICALLTDAAPERAPGNGYESLIEFVDDRPGHDTRYAIDATKMKEELDWQPEETFATGLKKTVTWYLENDRWWQNVVDGSYRLERIGTGNDR